ncbi:MAG: asparaginase [Actinomycetota bacterium]|nr:asparaginase [Actinomycetota bacterium]
MSAPPPVLVEVVRSGFVEGHHRGSVVALDADGTVVLSAGDVEAPVFPRSANKPLQAVGLLGAGLGAVLDEAVLADAGNDALLAVVASSHSGEPMHVELVARLLALEGRCSAELQCPPALPIDEVAAQALLAGGGQPDRIHMNCSGKHAGMLVACVRSGWLTPTYRRADHPLQRAIRATVERLAGEPVAAAGVDHCGAPLFALPLTAMARAYARLVMADPGSDERRVANAMRAHPDVVGGTGRAVTALMARVPGLLAKDGAEGVFAAALPDGRAVAVKIDDGANRASAPVLVAALAALGVDVSGLAGVATPVLYGGGQPVGQVRALPLA